MCLSLDLADLTVSGSAMTAAFVQHGLAGCLARRGDLAAAQTWDPRWLLAGGARRVIAHLVTALGYRRAARQAPIRTREGDEDGGWLFQSDAGISLRVWHIPAGAAADAPGRFGTVRAAQRVLLTCRERAGLLVHNETIRLLLCDPSRADSIVTFFVAGWREHPAIPDGFRVLAGLVGARGLPYLPDVLQAAAAHQTRVNIELRRQAKDAITGFINALPDLTGLDPAALWRESLLLIYRLLFILKLEGPAGFSFAATRLWRTALSPGHALGPLVRRHLDHGADTGRMLQDGLRTLFAIFRDGVSCSELCITALGGALFGADTTPLLDRLDWGERAVAILLDRLIWIPAPSGERVRVHYGSLDVEDLGSVYEALLEQEPHIAAECMVRVRRGRTEAIVPANGAPADIAAGRFFLRAGTGRKSTGSYYTPHEFVHFLVRETLAPKIAALCPPDDPRPADLLRLRIVDPATGSGHFLVEVCRQLGEALLNACIRCDELGLQDRIAALPDPDATLAAYLPSRGFSQDRARAICRRLVAVHCLYGCDRNVLAVELAKLSLWLESYAEGLPLTFLDHRLLAGDALTGPFLASLSCLPVTGGPLDPLLEMDVAARLNAAMARSRPLIRALDASIGRDLDDVGAKQALKRDLDETLRPLRQLARVWAGAAMAGDKDGDDVWLGLARQVADTGEWPPALTVRQAALFNTGQAAVTWDLLFPDIFPGGFSIVLGNPPWDVVLPSTKDFLAAYDQADGQTGPASGRRASETALLSRPAIAAAFARYRAGFERTKRVAQRLYRHQRADQTGGSLDLYRLFAERALQLVAPDGSIGLLVPSAFHANNGSTGIRQAYLQETTIRWCLSFENRRRLFDIDSRFKFDLIVADRPGPTQSLRCGFYLERIADADDPDKVIMLTMDFLRLAGGARMTPPELRGRADLAIAERFFANSGRLADWCRSRGIHFGCDLHMTHDAGCFRSPADGELVVHEGKTFHQYTDSWDTSPRYGSSSAVVPPAVAEAARYYRLAFRDIARSNDERTMIAFVAPPSTVFGHTATVEKAPWSRTNADALVTCALFNTFSFDWLVRQKAATHLSLYLLDGLPVPCLTGLPQRFLVHAALLLSCSHAGYDRLALEQVGKPLRGGRTASMRAAIDAVVADAYGLDRVQYRHVLSGFSHKSAPDVPARCLEAFDALQAEGVETFCWRNDPFADVGIVGLPARPVETAGLDVLLA